MRLNIAFICPIAFAGLAILPLPGQPADGLTVEGAVNGALARNAGLLAIRQRLREAEGQYVQAGVRPNPGLEVSIASGRLGL